jgi:hypothetical protein
MGCDIHLHIEVLLNGTWEHYAAPRVKCWYALFGVMAGVRDTEQVPISAPKGFPRDASALTRVIREDYGIDGHTDSWLDHEEIMRLEDWLAEQQRIDKLPFPGYDLEAVILNTTMCGNRFTSYWRYNDVSYLPTGITDIRFVFWFDN